MKVSIIGGGGRVGSNAAFALQCAAIVSEIHLLDANEQMAQGEALDLLHGASVAGDQKIYAENYEKCEHGDGMVPIWSSATAAGMALTKIDGFNPSVQQRVFERTKNSGAECLKTKGGAGWAVGLTIAEVVHAIALDQKKVLPVSTQLAGEYGIRNTCLSVPTLIGRGGV